MLNYFNILLLCCIQIFPFSLIKGQGEPALLWPNTTTYTPNSTYSSNLKAFLSSLSSNASRPNGFYNSIAGHTGPDVSPDVCQNCVSTATKDVTLYCSNGKIAAFWVNECLVRYSNQSLFGTTRSYTFVNTGRVSEPQRFLSILENVMDELLAKVAANGNGNKRSGKIFVTKEANYTSFQRVYTYAQCILDISSSCCDNCLRTAIGNLPSDGLGGSRVLLPSCNIRYELYPFYNVSVPPPALSVRGSPPRSLRGSIDSDRGKGGIASGVIVAIVVPIVVSILLFVFDFPLLRNADDISTAESLQYDLNTIRVATSNFSTENRIGEGRFGVVYKNETILIAMLQQKNLVRLLGYCLEGDEKILVYEFVPKKALTISYSVDYRNLHDDSHLRIIHRDLKASNILLDAEMNPKVSDFGMAKMFGIDQSEEITSRTVGIYGYMSPEYDMHEPYSVRSDVFRFGVLVWKNWRNGTPLNIMDSAFAESYSRNEVIQCIHIVLLCVQEDVNDRLQWHLWCMLNSCSITMRVPKQPALFLRSRSEMPPMKGLESDQFTTKSIPLSINEVSITEM
ncbi:unnamed protein product [Withania somnifera]